MGEGLKAAKIYDVCSKASAKNRTSWSVALMNLVLYFSNRYVRKIEKTSPAQFALLRARSVMLCWDEMLIEVALNRYNLFCA